MQTSNNAELARIFYEMAEILELQNVKWKPQAYIIAAQTVESLNQDVEDIYVEKGEKGINDLPGIGEGITKKIIQFLKTGKIEEYEKLKSEIPQGLYEMMRIPGVGAKKASLFYNKLNIKDIDQLEEAARSKKLIGLPGFKEKAEKNILEGIELMKSQHRIPLSHAKKIADSLIKEMKKIKNIKEIMPAGSLRRKRSTIGDIDLVALVDDPYQKDILSKFGKMKFVKKIIGQGKEKASVITKDNIQADLRVFNEDEFGAGLLYFTGDKQHNIWLRKIAIKKGWKLNEYGLFKGNKRIAGKTEQEIYKRLGLTYIKPENRIGEIK